jgi:hypothetical protein
MAFLFARRYLDVKAFRDVCGEQRGLTEAKGCIRTRTSQSHWVAGATANLRSVIWCIILSDCAASKHEDGQKHVSVDSTENVACRIEKRIRCRK